MTVVQVDPVETAATPDYVSGWDGIRALAVVAVIIFHFWPDAAPGGFLGVTTFLVLAGALAVLRIGREVDRTAGFAWRDYAVGRIRRLIPALLLYLMAVLVWTWWRHPEVYDAIARDVAAAALYLTPWREMVGSASYETAFDTTPAPALHTWSLGVEELAWILTGLAVALSGRVRAAATFTLVVGVVGYLVWFGEADLYYSPARLLEFGIGAVVGLVLLRRTPPVPTMATLAATGVFVWACAAWSVDQVYGGRLLVAAGLSAVMVMGAVQGPVAAALSHPVLRWIGTRSYALYLWHVGFGELTELDPVVALVATVVASELSYRLVETPLRRWRSSRGRTAVVMLGATAGIAAFAIWGPRPAVDVATAGELLDELAVDTGSAGTDAAGASPVESPATTSTAAAAVDPTSTVAAPTAPPIMRRPTSVHVVGDSTAVRLEPILGEWGGRLGIDVTGRGEAILGCSPAGTTWDLHLDLPGVEVIPANDTCAPDDEAVAAAELVVVSYQGSLILEHRPAGRDDLPWSSLATSDELRTTIAAEFERLADLNDGLVVLLTVPAPELDGFGPGVLDAANRLLVEVAAGRDDIVVVDSSVIAREPSRYPRTDGVHLDPAGAAAYVVAVLDPRLVVAA